MEASAGLPWGLPSPLGLGAARAPGLRVRSETKAGLSTQGRSLPHSPGNAVLDIARGCGESTPDWAGHLRSTRTPCAHWQPLAPRPAVPKMADGVFAPGELQWGAHSSAHWWLAGSWKDSLGGRSGASVRTLEA